MTSDTIFIVDDEPNNFDVIESILSDLGYLFFYASSGEEALDMMEVIQPDVILLDVMMPGKNGLEVCNRLKADEVWQHVPIIMVTALNEKEDLARCLDAGADDFLTKPIDSVELRARIQSMIRIKRQYDQLKAFNQLQQKTIELLNENLTTLQANLAFSIPHEIMTPLNGIMGALTLLQYKKGENRPESEEEFIDVALASAGRLEKLIIRLLNYFLLLDAGSSNDSPPESLSSNLIESIALSKAKAYGRQNDLTFDVIPTALLIIAPNHLIWLVEELVCNACKFSQQGSPIRLLGRPQAQNRFLLSVADQGRGMTADQIDKIGAFIQFERDVYEQQGVGLGLAIVSKIVTRYGGELVVSSQDRLGTTVQVVLPLVEP